MTTRVFKGMVLAEQWSVWDENADFVGVVVRTPENRFEAREPRGDYLGTYDAKAGAQKALLRRWVER